MLPARRIKVLPKSRRKALLVWSDAMWEVKETGKRRQVAKIRLGQFKAQLGFVAYDPEKDKYYHASLVVGMEIISKFVPDSYVHRPARGTSGSSSICVA